MTRAFLPRALALAVLALAAPAAASFVTFETGQVRPLALSPDGTRLFACNTPDGRLEIFAVDDDGLTHAGSVPVGLEPAAVAARTDGEVWVVNHLSDSVSIVDVASSPPRVVRTLLVGDDPRDIVFAGPGRTRAFITTAHRGQNSVVDPQLTTPGVGRADVWVFDATNLGTALGGTPLTVLTLFGDTPRALAVAPDGDTVYAAVFHSGNRTTTVSEGVVCDGGATAPPCNVGGFTMPGGLPAPNRNVQNIPGPETGLTVKFDPATNQWRDQLGRNWNNAVRFSLPDYDVFRIDAAATPPVATAQIAGVGTILFNMIVNPANQKLYVTNTEARNEVRFEGPGILGTTVRGRLHQTRITVVDGTTVTPRHLNKHIDYDVFPAPPGTKEDSLSIPLGMAVSSDGTTLYVAAFGSAKIGVFDTAALEADTFTPDAADHITVSGGGPSGVVLDEARGRLYVLTRFDDAVSVIDLATRLEIAHLPLHNPEPAAVVAGRPVLYDALTTTGNGESPCASCHVFGDFDSLAWDLGNPDDVVLNNPNPIEFNIGANPDFHPLKGPMTTQSLRGMANHGPMHWRGDRTAGNDPGGDPLDERGAFLKFIVAFEGLLGRDGPIPDADMEAFADFILQVTYPPNPIRNLDNSLTPSQLAGRNLFNGRITDVVRNCNGCHVLAPAAGFFGSDGDTSFENEPQLVKIPHLRNMYQKVGMFGMPAVPFFRAGDNGHKGDQVRGFGFLHDGSVDTLFRFHGATVFTNVTEEERRDLEAFMLAFDSNLAPIVGQQTTLTATNAAIVDPRINLLIARAAAVPSECDVVAKGTVAGEQRGWVRLPGGQFRSDRATEPLLGDAQVRAFAATPGQEITFTCVPPGSGLRAGVDRDEDGHFDRDELDAGSDPADANSIPGGSTTSSTSTTSTSSTSTTAPTTTTLPLTLVGTKSLKLRDGALRADPSRRRLAFKTSTKRDPLPNRVSPPPAGGPGDPTTGVGGTLIVYNSSGATPDRVTVNLPQAGWSIMGSAANLKGYRFVDKTPGAPITSVVVKKDTITVKGRGAAWGYTLDEPFQGRIAVRLILGNAAGWCSDAPARTSGSPPSTAKNDTIDRFVAAPTPPPASCPP